MATSTLELFVRGWLSDPTNHSEPGTPPPVERSCDPPDRARRTSRRRIFQAGGVGAACVVMGAVIAAFYVEGTAPAPAVVEVEDSALRIDGDSIVLTQRLEAQLGLRTAIARQTRLSPLVSTTGTVSFDPRFTAAVGARIPGLVRSVAHFEGDLVKAGEGLAVIQGAELGNAQADVFSLRAHEQAASSSFDREEGLGARGLSSKRRMEAAAARYSVLKSKRFAAEQRVTALGGANDPTALGVYRLKSPIAGTIVERHVNEGQSVEDHRIAFRVANLDHLWVELSVAEPQLRGVSAGDPVEVCATAMSLECVKGSVAHVGEQVDPINLVVTVRIEVDNSARKLRAGQAVTAKIRPSGVAASDAVVVPRSAVVRVDGQPTVFVATVDRRIVPTKVELAESNESEQRIASGISAGQTVVSEGASALTKALFR